MQLIKQPIGGNNQFGTIDILPDKLPNDGTTPFGIFLCGSGSVGNGSATSLNLLANGEIPQGIKDSADKYGMIWICPQTSAVYNQGEIDYAIKVALGRYGVNPLKCYGAGLSLGAGALFSFVMSSVTNASKFAAISPMATTYPVGDPKNIAIAHLPVWASHNLNDTNGGTPVNATISTINAINNTATVKAAMTIMNQSGHGSWGEMTSVTTIPIPAGSSGLINPPYNLYEWFLLNSLGKPVAAGVGTPPVTQPPATDMIIHSYQLDVYASGKTVSSTLK